MLRLRIKIYDWAFIITFTLLMATICGCNENDKYCVPNPQPSVYYWRTTYSTSPAEKSFIKKHHIKKMYLRLFDVIAKREDIIPNATITFSETPDTALEIIPVIFITEECLHHDINRIAEKLTKRAIKICEANDLKAPGEIQIDCDYTARSRKTYNSFLAQLRKSIQHTSIKQISVTIRLHQLSMPVLENVDYGVMMMYNTGDVRKKKCENPILSFDCVKPYLRYLADYSLPLCTAYPCFNWQLLYRNNRFKAFLHEENLEDSTIYKRVTRDKYVVISSRDLPSFIGDDYAIHLNTGDSIIIHQVETNEIIKVKQALERYRKNINKQVILYDLNEKNINRYKTNDYEEIFNY